MNQEENTASLRVSVVVTTRNRLQWLKRCVDSVESQKGVSWELIIVDDASDDQTWPWLRGITSANVRTFHLEQRCERCIARNHGLAKAKGRYVMFLDDDDLLWPDALRLLSTALVEHPDAVATTGARWAIFTGEDYERRDAHPRRLLKRNIMDELLFGWSAVSGQNMYRTLVIRSIGGYEDVNLIPCEDRLLWLRVAAIGSVVLRPEVVMSYRYHDNQVRPTDIQSIRDAVARRAIRALPKNKRRKALLLRRSGRMIEQAEEEMSGGNPFTAVCMTCKAVLNTPGIFTSVLIGEWVVRRLAGRLYRRMFPKVA